MALAGCTHQAERNSPFYEVVLGWAQRDIDGGGQYLAQDCSDPITNYPAYEDLPVYRCSYSELGQSALVYVLLADADLIASWISGACFRYAKQNQASCVVKTYNALWEASNGQIPISGVVIEPRGILPNYPADDQMPMNFVFRDGITTRTSLAINGTIRIVTENEIENLASAPIIGLGSFVRPISATREMLTLVGYNSDELEDNYSFINILRRLHVAAWQTGKNDAVDAWVAANFTNQ